MGWAYSELFIQTYGGYCRNKSSVRLLSTCSQSCRHEKSLTDKIYNQQNINKYNELIRKMAAEQQVYYLDAAAAVQDDGYLPAEQRQVEFTLKPALPAVV